MFGKQKLAALAAEFLGAGVLTLVVLRVMYSSLGVPFFVALGAGLALTMLVFVFAARSWGYFNPAITLGLWTVRKIDTVTAALYVVAQLLGAWAAYALYSYIASSDAPALNQTFSWHAMTIEAVGSGIFAIGVAAAIYQGVSRAATAAFAGLALMLGMLVSLTAVVTATGVPQFTGGFLNPAVALGVHAWDIWGANGWGVSVLGSVVGALVGFNVYAYLFAETAPFAVRRASAAPVAAKPAANKKASVKKPAAKKKTATRKK